MSHSEVKKKKKRAHLKTTQTIESKCLVHRFRGYVLKIFIIFFRAVLSLARLSQGQ